MEAWMESLQLVRDVNRDASLNCTVRITGALRAYLVNLQQGAQLSQENCRS